VNYISLLHPGGGGGEGGGYHFLWRGKEAESRRQKEEKKEEGVLFFFFLPLLHGGRVAQCFGAPESGTGRPMEPLGSVEAEEK